MATQTANATIIIPEREQQHARQRAVVEYTLPLETWKKTADLTELPTAGNATDLGLVAGTHGTNTPSLQSTDSGTISVTEKCRRTWTLPAEYDEGQDVQVLIHAGMKTTVSDGTATVDVECYEADKAAGLGSDLCTTSALDINNLAADTYEDKVFTIDGSGLVVGDTLDIEITVAITDTSTVPAVTGFIGKTAMRIDIRMG
jgi:hypothetical protein